MLLIGTLGTNFSEILINTFILQLYIFIQENAFENVIWKMVAILSRPQYVYDKHMAFVLRHITCNDSHHWWLDAGSQYIHQYAS